MSRIKDVENDIKAIRSNDLPHIYSRLGKVEGKQVVIIAIAILILGLTIGRYFA